MRAAQNLGSHLGSVLRLNDDGSAPQDNPFVGREDALPEIFSYGHRNVQGLTLHPDSGALWSHEHGPRGGDEVNILQPGANYGWPVVTHGIDYSGAIISEETSAPGMTAPLVYWRSEEHTSELQSLMRISYAVFCLKKKKKKKQKT